jgi:hypothetical protein
MPPLYPTAMWLIVSYCCREQFDVFGQTHGDAAMPTLPHHARRNTDVWEDLDYAINYLMYPIAKMCP